MTAPATIAIGEGCNGGELTINWVETNPVRTIFFWSDGCATGSLEYADNFLTAILYSPTSDLFCKATKQPRAAKQNL